MNIRSRKDQPRATKLTFSTKSKHGALYKTNVEINKSCHAVTPVQKSRSYFFRRKLPAPYELVVFFTGWGAPYC